MVKWQEGRPVYLRVAAEIRAKILSGDYVDKLPPVKQLVATTKAGSTSVVQRAVALLESEGFVEAQHGRANLVHMTGVVVIDAVPFIDPKQGKISYRLLEATEDVPPADARHELGLAAEGVAVLRKQIGYREEGPVEYVLNYYPVEIARGTPLAGRLRIDGGASAYLERQGHMRAEMVDIETVRAPTEDEAEALELPEGVPVFRVLRTISDPGGKPIEVSVVVKGGHRYAIRHRTKLH